MIQRLQAKRNEEGFTLIELLIVIIVLGILAAIVVFAVAGTRDDAVASRCKTDVKSIELSAEGVYAKTGNYSTAVENSATAAANSNDFVAGQVTFGTPPGTNGALLKSWPSSTDYALSVPANSSTATVFLDNGAAAGHAGNGILDASDETAVTNGCSGL
jgi:prepilin-type N-terminal cleavage/methylation domain-containing protein